uniref:Rab-GAP TBC domain-containing protein n=1 Tax=Hanusia phi TaxID=3032 RepID=A0A7S0EZD2_9CRYP|mmetsp:Transcript_34774/g.78536  ORF Transcript_34774/g.78536 Transcript_34774/m.78536 type:complete len:702 (+) Transcript_34774:39-2144(+)
MLQGAENMLQGAGWDKGLQSMFQSLWPWSRTEEEEGAVDGLDRGQTDSDKKSEVKIVSLQELNIQARECPLLLLVAFEHEEEDKLMCSIARCFRARIDVCTLVESMEQVSEHLEPFLVGQLVAETRVFFLTKHGGLCHAFSYRDDLQFEPLALFVAANLHSQSCPAAYLRHSAFVRYLLQGSQGEILGEGPSSEGPCLLLVTNSIEPPDWFANVSRIFHPCCKFGFVCESILRRCVHISDKAIDPRSPSNPSNQSYILLFLVPSEQWLNRNGIEKGASSAARSSDPHAIQFRGSSDVEAVCGFLSNVMYTCRRQRTAAKTVKPPVDDDSWVGIVYKHGSDYLRRQLREACVSRTEWQNRRAHRLELQRCRATAMEPVLCEHLASNSRQCEALALKAIWRQGLPEEIRGRLWAEAIGNAASLEAEHYHAHVVVARDFVKKGDFMDRTCRSKEEGGLEDHLRQITLDLERTFPGMYFFSRNGPFHQDLREVLFALSATRPDLGYVQGMSHVAALLLLYMPACSAYIALVNELDKYHFRDFFLIDIERIDRYCAAFHVVLLDHAPKLACKLRQAGVDARLYLLKWWMTAFASVLPIQKASRVWDIFLLEGFVFLLQFTVALLCSFSKQLLRSELEQALSLLTHVEDEDVDIESVIEKALKVEVKYEEFMELVERERVVIPEQGAVNGARLLHLSQLIFFARLWK